MCIRHNNACKVMCSTDYKYNINNNNIIIIIVIIIVNNSNNNNNNNNNKSLYSLLIYTNCAVLNS